MTLSLMIKLCIQGFTKYDLHAQFQQFKREDCSFLSPRPHPFWFSDIQVFYALLVNSQSFCSMWREGLCEILPEARSRGSIVHFVFPNAGGKFFFLLTSKA